MGKTPRTKVKDSSRYLKRIVAFSISFIVLFTITSMILNYKINLELNPTLTTCVYAFFGTELCATSVIKVVEIMLQKEEQKRQKEEQENREKEEVL